MISIISLILAAGAIAAGAGNAAGALLLGGQQVGAAGLFLLTISRTIDQNAKNYSKNQVFH